MRYLSGQRTFHSLLLITIAMASAANGWSADDDASNPVLFVQAQRVSLHEGAKENAKVVAALRRGEAVRVIERQGKWAHVKRGDRAGWMPELFLSEHRPVGKASLLRDLPENQTKASRRRPSSYQVSAAARSVDGSVLKTEGTDKADAKGVKTIETAQPAPDKIRAFDAEAGLNQN